MKEVATAIKTELRNYSKGKSITKYNGDPVTLKTLMSKDLLEEANEKMPITHTTATACSKTGVKYQENKQALALSVILNSWLPHSNFVYRINTMLTAGCCKTEVMDIFHRLTLSSHPNMICAQLQSSADHFDSEILVWKRHIESTQKQEKLLQEALSSTGSSGDTDDAMKLCYIDFSRSTVENQYKYFNDEAYESCKELLPDQDQDVYEDTDLVQAYALSQQKKLPLYRCVEYVSVCTPLQGRGHCQVTDSVCLADTKKPDTQVKFCDHHLIKQCDKISNSGLGDTGLVVQPWGFQK